MKAPTIQELANALRDAGKVDDVQAVLDSNAAIAADPLETTLPWYMRALVGAGGWLTGLFVVFWMVFAVVCVGEVEEGGLVMALSAVVGFVGLLFAFGVGWLPELVRVSRTQRLADDGDVPATDSWAALFGRTVALDFMGQLGVVAILAGQLGFAIGLVELLNDEAVLFLVLVVQALFLFLVPSATVRFVAALSIGLWCGLLEENLGGSGLISLGLVTATTVVWWGLRPIALRTPAWESYTSIGYGLAAATLLGHVLSAQSVGLAVVSGVLAVPLVVLLVREAGLSPVAMVAGSVAAISVAALTSAVPGVAVSLLVLALGARAGDRILQGGAVIGLLGYGVYDTVLWDVGHEVRFGVLVGVGVVFLLCALGLRRAAPVMEAT